MRMSDEHLFGLRELSRESLRVSTALAEAFQQKSASTNGAVAERPSIGVATIIRADGKSDFLIPYPQEHSRFVDSLLHFAPSTIRVTPDR